MYLQKFSRILWTVNQPFARLLHTQDNTNTERNTSIPQVALEPTVPVPERSKPFGALDFATAVISLGTVVSNIVTCPLKARTVEPKEATVSRQWLCKHVSTATKLRGHSNGHTQQ
jgi:hypothetical protein